MGKRSLSALIALLTVAFWGGEAAATPKPPSERSCAERARPLARADCTALKEARAVRVSTAGAVQPAPRPQT